MSTNQSFMSLSLSSDSVSVSLSALELLVEWIQCPNMMSPGICISLENESTARWCWSSVSLFKCTRIHFTPLSYWLGHSISSSLVEIETTLSNQYCTVESISDFNSSNSSSHRLIVWYDWIISSLVFHGTSELLSIDGFCFQNSDWGGRTSWSDGRGSDELSSLAAALYSSSSRCAAFVSLEILEHSFFAIFCPSTK